VVAAASPIFLKRRSTLGPGLTDQDRTSGISEPRQTLEKKKISLLFSLVCFSLGSQGLPFGCLSPRPTGVSVSSRNFTALVRATAVYVFRQSRIIVLSQCASDGFHRCIEYESTSGVVTRVRRSSIRAPEMAQREDFVSGKKGLL